MMVAAGASSGLRQDSDVSPDSTTAADAVGTAIHQQEPVGRRARSVTQIRVLFVGRSLDIGGMERQLVETARGLLDRGWHVTVILFYGEGELVKELERAGIACESLRKKGRWDILRPMLRLVRLVRGLRPDFIYSYLVGPNLLVAICKPFLGAARLVWGVRVSNLDLSAHDYFWRLTFAVSRWVASAVDLIIVNSDEGRLFHARMGYPVEKMIAIPNGIDTDRFVPDRASAVGLRKQWASHGTQLVGMVANLRPMKDHENFIRALRFLDERVHFVCVGGGAREVREHLERLADSIGVADRIIWAGEREDMTQVYNALDVVCLSSSDGEGFPNVLGEALACGVPCVATDVGDSALVVDDYGIIVPPKDPLSLASAIQEILARGLAQDEDFVSSSRDWVVRRFSCDALAVRTEEALLRIP